MKNKDTMNLKEIEYDHSNEQFIINNKRFSAKDIQSLKDMLAYLEDPAKIKLTNDELIILKNLDMKYQWMARDKDDTLYFFVEKPEKCPNFWTTSEEYTTGFSKLFKFVHWQDEFPYRIEELLDDNK